MYKFVTHSPRVEAGSNTSTVTLRVVGGDEKESLKSETVKYGRESKGTRTQERLRWQEPAAYTKDRPVLSSERALHKTRPQLSKSNYYLTVSRNVTLTLTCYTHTVQSRVAQKVNLKSRRICINLDLSGQIN
jgi:hypothetical protein